MDSQDRPQERRGPLHQRPRLGDEGEVWIPLPVTVDEDGTVHATRSRRAVDPFESSDDGLLLVESFARLRLDDHVRLQRWLMFHGTLDRAGFWRGPSKSPDLSTRYIALDSATDLAEEQAVMGLVLESLVSLSDGRHGGWEPRVPRDPPSSSMKRAGLSRAAVRELGLTWEGSVELLRRILAPYVVIAAERSFVLRYETRETPHGIRQVLVPHDGRTWNSILAPMALQLLEALRRVTEGEAAATRCQDCNEPFLMLDARRRFYCNERHRRRHTERNRRRRRTDATNADVPQGPPASDRA